MTVLVERGQPFSWSRCVELLRYGHAVSLAGPGSTGPAGQTPYVVVGLPCVRLFHAGAIAHHAFHRLGAT